MVHYDETLNVVTIRGSAALLEALFKDVQWQIENGYRGRRDIPTPIQGQTVRYYFDQAQRPSISFNNLDEIYVYNGLIIHDNIHSPFSTTVQTGLKFFEEPSGTFGASVKISYEKFGGDSTNPHGGYVESYYTPVVEGTPIFESTYPGKWGFQLLPGIWMDSEYIYRYIAPYFPEPYVTQDELLYDLSSLVGSNIVDTSAVANIFSAYGFRFARLFGQSFSDFICDTTFPPLSLTTFQQFLETNPYPFSRMDNAKYHPNSSYYSPPVEDFTPLTWGAIPCRWGAVHLERDLGIGGSLGSIEVLYNPRSISMNSYGELLRYYKSDAVVDDYEWISVDYFWWLVPDPEAHPNIVGICQPLMSDDLTDPILFTTILIRDGSNVIFTNNQEDLSFAKFSLLRRVLDKLNSSELVQFVNECEGGTKVSLTQLMRWGGNLGQLVDIIIYAYLKPVFAVSGGFEDLETALAEAFVRFQKGAFDFPWSNYKQFFPNDTAFDQYYYFIKNITFDYFKSFFTSYYNYHEHTFDSADHCFEVGSPQLPYPNLTELLDELDLDQFHRDITLVGSDEPYPLEVINETFSFSESFTILPKSYVIYFRYSDIASLLSTSIAVSEPSVFENSIYLTPGRYEPPFKVVPLTAYTEVYNKDYYMHPRYVKTLKIEGPLIKGQTSFDVLEQYADVSCTVPLYLSTSPISFLSGCIRTTTIQPLIVSDLAFSSPGVIESFSSSVAMREAVSNLSVYAYKKVFDKEEIVNPNGTKGMQFASRCPTTAWAANKLILNPNYAPNAKTGKIEYAGSTTLSETLSKKMGDIAYFNRILEESSEDAARRLYCAIIKILGYRSTITNIADPENRLGFTDSFATVCQDVRSYLEKELSLNASMVLDSSRQSAIASYLLDIDTISGLLLDRYDYEVSTLILAILKDYYMYCLYHGFTGLLDGIMTRINAFQIKSYAQMPFYITDKQRRGDVHKYLADMWAGRLESYSNDEKLLQWAFHELQVAKRQFIYYRNFYSLTYAAGVVTLWEEKILAYEPAAFHTNAVWYEAQFDFTYAKVIALSETSIFESMSEFVFCIQEMEFFNKMMNNTSNSKSAEIEDAYARYVGFSSTRTTSALTNRMKMHNQTGLMWTTTNYPSFYKYSVAYDYLWYMLIDHSNIGASITWLANAATSRYFSGYGELTFTDEVNSLGMDSYNIALDASSYYANMQNGLGSKSYEAYFIDRLLWRLKEYSAYSCAFTTLNTAIVSKHSTVAQTKVLADNLSRATAYTQASISSIGKSIYYDTVLLSQKIDNRSPILNEHYYDRAMNNIAALYYYVTDLDIIQITTTDVSHGTYQTALEGYIADLAPSIAALDSSTNNLEKYFYYKGLQHRHSIYHLSQNIYTEEAYTEFEAWKCVLWAGNSYTHLFTFYPSTVLNATGDIGTHCSFWCHTKGVVETSATSLFCARAAAYYSGQANVLNQLVYERWVASNQTPGLEPYGDVARHFARSTLALFTIEEIAYRAWYDITLIDVYNYYNSDAHHGDYHSLATAALTNVETKWIDAMERQRQILFWCDTDTRLRNETYLAIAKYEYYRLPTYYTSSALDMFVAKADMKRSLDRISEMKMFAACDALETTTYDTYLSDSSAVIASVPSGTQGVRNTFWRLATYYPHLTVLHHKISELYDHSQSPTTNVRQLARHQTEAQFYKTTFDTRFAEISNAVNEMMALQDTNPIPSGEYSALTWSAAILAVQLQSYSDEIAVWVAGM